MNVLCSICSSEMVLASNEIFSTPCGHIFHHECLIQWIERSKSCPHCRKKATLNTIHKIYFNFSNNDSVMEEDPSFLRQRIESLKFQIEVKDREIDTLKTTENKLKKETLGLRQEVRKVESNIKNKESVIFALKEQLKYFREENQEMNSCKNEIKVLKKELDLLKNIQVLIEASMPEVDAMLTKTHDTNTLAIYVSILKRELKLIHQKRTNLRDMYITLQQKYKQSQEELRKENNICKKLREENQQINQKLTLTVNETLKNEELEEDNMEILQNTANLRENKDSEKSKSIVSESRKQEDNDCYIICEDYNENTPEQEKSQKSHSMKRANNHLKIPSILTKKSKFSQLSQKTVIGNGMMNFDGFGGHAKYDAFPSRSPSVFIEKTKEKAKMKQLKLNVNGNKLNPM